MTPIFIRGVGALSPLGATWDETANALAAGTCAIREVDRFDVADFPCRVAASVDGDHGDDRRLGFARHAALAAWRKADVSGRAGVFVGAESGRASFSTVLALARAAGSRRPFDHARFGVEARRLAQRIDPRSRSPAAVASALAAEIGAEGPVETVSLACSSSAAAIVDAVRAIRLGECDVALAGGVGADVDPLMMAGFGLLGILSPRGVSRPFDVRRDGFVIGEGASFLVLSRERGDAPAAILGASRSMDAHHLTAPHPEGAGATRAMTAAIADAGAPSIGYVQAHGTSTTLNDAIEAKAIDDLLGEVPVASVKGALGHWIAGAGALGVLCAYEAVVNGRLLPTAGLEKPDSVCPGRHVIGEAVEANVEAALANAFAFGGANSAIVVGRG